MGGITSEYYWFSKVSYQHSSNRLVDILEDWSSLAGTEKMFPGAILLAYEMKTHSVSIYLCSGGRWLDWGGED